MAVSGLGLPTFLLEDASWGVLPGWKMCIELGMLPLTLRPEPKPQSLLPEPEPRSLSLSLNLNLCWEYILTWA